MGTAASLHSLLFARLNMSDRHIGWPVPLISPGPSLQQEPNDLERLERLREQLEAGIDDVPKQMGRAKKYGLGFEVVQDVVRQTQNLFACV